MALSLFPARVSGPSSEVSPCIWGFHPLLWSFVCREWFGHSDKSGFRQKSKSPLQENPARLTLAREGERGRAQLCPTPALGTNPAPAGPWPCFGTSARSTDGLGLRACTRLGSAAPPWPQHPLNPQIPSLAAGPSPRLCYSALRAHTGTLLSFPKVFSGGFRAGEGSWAG